MTPVNEVLVRLGQPPAEICLDWAWQLQQLDNPSPSSNQADAQLGLKHDDDLLAAWANFAVDAEGILHRCTPPTAATLELSLVPIRPMIAELNRWAELNSPGEVVHGKRQSATATEAETAQPPAAPLSVISPLGPTQGLSTQPRSTQPRSTQPRSTQRRLTSTAGQSQRQPIRQRRPLRPGWSKRVYYAAGLLVAAVGMGLFSVYREANWLADQPTAQDSVPTASGQPAALTGQHQALPLTEPAEVTLSFPIDPAVPGTLDRTVAAESQLAIDFTLSGQEMDTAGDGGIDLSFGLPQPQTPPATANDQQSPSLDGSVPGPVGEPPVDVLRELADLAQTATTQISEHTVDATADSSLASEQPAWVLDIAPPNQLQTFDKSLRPRQPRWQIRLAAVEGLQVLPSDAQSVAGRDWISWVVREEPSENSKRDNFADFSSSSQMRTEVLVQVQLAHQRQTSLRWRIVALASDFPGLAIPLDRDWLAQAQNRLGLLTQRLSVAVERTRTLGRADGLPSAVRSELSAQRRSLETQHKVAKRWLEIVADAHQYHGWLDGQFEVHAELYDSAQSPSPAILRFGNP